jgi:O-antigen/teichoic acid export membrane protein
VGGFEYFYWLVPLGILVTGLMQIFTAWNTRQLFYKNISISRIVQSCAVVSSQLSLSLFNLNSLGLIFGNLIGITISLTVLVFESIKNHTVKIKLVSETLLRQNFKRYDNFPKFQSFSVLINSFSQHLPVLLLISFYSPIIAGFYGLTYRALNTPARLLGGSVRQVYYQRASELFNNGRGIVSFYKKTTFGLIKITILPYLVIGIFAEKLFTVIFGAEWGISGIYAQILILFIFTITINPPTVMNIQILGIQKFHLKYEILLALCRFISIYVGFAVFNNHYISIGLFSVVGILFNVFLMIYVYLKLVKIEKTKLIYETN